MHFSLLTLFPEFFDSPLQSSILKRASEKKITSYQTINMRDFCEDKHKQVDDSVYGGGSGMLIKPEPIAQAIESQKKIYPLSEVIYFAPWGKKMTQDLSYQFANNMKDKILICGHYEGIDERVIESHVDHVISVGETVVTGGEIPALFFLDSVVRLLPGSIGKESSHQQESFSFQLYGKGEYPQYTKPEIWRGKKVPEVLLSGHHEKIKQFQVKYLRNCSDTEKQIIYLRNNEFSPEKPKKYRNFYLRIPIWEDIKTWMKWFNDEEVCKYMRKSSPYSKEEEEFFFHWQHYNTNMLKLEIIDKTSKENIGTASWEVSDDKVGKYGLVIGNKDFWNKGLATEVTKEMISIAKEMLGLRKLTLDVFTENTAAQRVYEKCGFTKMGKSVHFYQKNGKWADAFFYEMIV